MLTDLIACTSSTYTQTEKGIMKYLKDYSVLEFQNLDDNKDVCT